MIQKTTRACLLMLAIAAPALAHEGEPLKPHDLLTAWEFDPGIVIPLVLSGWLYLRGIRRSGVWRKMESAAYAFGWTALVVALVSPIHPLGEALLSVHMTQHSILMLVAAPLLVVSRPLAPYLFALPAAWRTGLVRLGKRGWFQNAWRFVTRPFVAFVLSGVGLWVWHMPALYQRTVESDLVHSAQHITFLVTALLFWWAIIHGRVHGVSAAYLFITAVHTSVLGALMTVSQSLWYPVYADRTAAWGLTPLEDQQLAGLIMWVPCGLVYLGVALALFALWLRESDGRRGLYGNVAQRKNQRATNTSRALIERPYRL